MIPTDCISHETRGKRVPASLSAYPGTRPWTRCPGRLKEVIDTDGPQAIAWIKGQGPGWQSAWDFCQRFMNAIEAPNLVQHGHDCHFGRGAGHVATDGWMPYPGLRGGKANCLVGVQSHKQRLDQSWYADYERQEARRSLDRD